MRPTIALIIIIVLLPVTALSGSLSKTGEVRNPSGKLLYRTKTTGNTTEVRSPTGKLLMRSKTTDGTTEVRSPSGKLLERIRVK